MEEAHAYSHDEVPNSKQRKKKSSTQAHPLSQVKGNNKGFEMPNPSIKTQKRSLKNEPSPSFQHSDRSTPDSLPDSSTSSEYRALRRKYLLLEEEGFALGNQLSEVEADVKSLEDEKHALLDQLVVLEGLIDPSELQQTVRE